MTPTHQSEQSTIRDYLSVIQRRKWIVIVMVVLVPLAATALALRQTKEYQGSADVLLTQQDVASSLTGVDLNGQQPDPARFAETQAQLAKVPQLAQQVLTRAGLQRSPAQLIANLDVSPEQNADLLTFKVTDPNRGLASELTTLYAQEFIGYRQKLQNQALVKAKLEVDSQLSRLARSKRQKSPLYADLQDRSR